MKIERLQNIAEIIAGQSPPSNTYNQNGDGLPFFQGKADFGEMHPTARYWCTMPTKIALPNDILLSVRAPVGPVNLCHIESCIGRGLSAIRVNKKANPEYVYYFLKANERQLEGLGVGSTFKAITQKDVRNLPIPIPENIDDQIRIASILRKTETLIKHRKENIKLIDDFLQSTFLKMFGDPINNEKKWETKTIETLVKKQKHSIKRGPFGGALKKEIFVRQGYLVYEQYHALNNDFTFERYYIDEKKFHELKAFEVFPGDIIISCSGIYLGKLAVVPANAKKGIINQALLKLSLDNSIISNEFFVFLFSHNSIKRKFFGDSRGSGIPNFPPMEEFKKFKFVYPPKKDQDKFTKILKSAEILKSQFNKSLHELENLFGSLSKKAFNGKLNLSIIDIFKESKVLISDNNSRVEKSNAKAKNYADKIYGDPFEVDEVAARKKGIIFYKEWKRLRANELSVKLDESESIWIQAKKIKKTDSIAFNFMEGEAIIRTVFSKKLSGFSFQDFEAFLKKESFDYSYSDLQEFIFQQLEDKKIDQLYASKEWMESNLKRVKQNKDDFAGEGRVWFLTNNNRIKR